MRRTSKGPEDCPPWIREPNDLEEARSQGILTDREAEMLRIRLFVFQSTLVDIGNRFGVSRERARSVISKAIEKLRAGDWLQEATGERARARAQARLISRHLRAADDDRWVESGVQNTVPSNIADELLALDKEEALRDLLADIEAGLDVEIASIGPSPLNR